MTEEKKTKFNFHGLALEIDEEIGCIKINGFSVSFAILENICSGTSFRPFIYIDRNNNTGEITVADFINWLEGRVEMGPEYVAAAQWTKKIIQQIQEQGT